MPILICLGMLTGCSGLAPSPAAQEALTPEVVTVQITPALAHLRPALAACAQQQPQMGLAVRERPADAPDLPGVQIRLRWGAPAQASGYAAVLGLERMVVIAAAGSPRQSITMEELKQIYTSATPDKITAWVYPAGDDSQQLVEALLGVPVRASAAGTAPDPAAMLQAVAASPDAVGFAPAGALNGSVRAIPVEGVDEGRWQQPVLAFTAVEPQGTARNLMACLQEKLKP